MYGIRIVQVITWLTEQTNFMEQNPPCKADSFSAIPKNYLRFVEPEGPLPHLRQSAICPYPEPVQ
jgi:hypothetical protein